jgi:hypothetical protein
MIALVEDRQLWPVLFIILRAFPITAAQRLGYAWIELGDGLFEFAADLCERPS